MPRIHFIRRSCDVVYVDGSEHVSKGTSDGECVTDVASTSSFDKHGQHEIENLPTNSLQNLSDRNH